MYAELLHTKPFRTAGEKFRESPATVHLSHFQNTLICDLQISTQSHTPTPCINRTLEGQVAVHTCCPHFCGHHTNHTFEDWMSISNPAAAAALTTGSNRLGSGVGWRRSSEHDGKCATIFSATEMLASNIISSTIWLASRTCARQGREEAGVKTVSW